MAMWPEAGVRGTSSRQKLMETSRLAIVAALEREVVPFVKRWHRRERVFEGRPFRFFEDGGWALVCGGIGARAARRATEAIIHFYGPSCVASVGFAGALDEGLRFRSVVVPRRIVDASDGSSFDTGRGADTLLSFSSVAGVAQKAKLHRAYGAQAIDMEAAAVACAARAHGLDFFAVKAISDESDFELPPLGDAIDAEGRFFGGRFLASVASKPWLWFRVFQLARHSACAARSLSRWLEQYSRQVRGGEESELERGLPGVPIEP